MFISPRKAKNQIFRQPCLKRFFDKIKIHFKMISFGNIFKKTKKNLYIYYKFTKTSIKEGLI